MFLNDEIDFFGEELTELIVLLGFATLQKFSPVGMWGPLLNAYIACCDI